MAHVIELKHLTKTYGKKNAVKNLTFRIERGEIFGFIGPNGAGKSTTIKAILGLISATHGDISLFGQVMSLDRSHVNQRIGYLSSEANFYEYMTVAQLLDYAAGFYKGNFSNRIKYLVSYFELDTSLKISALSLGNKKKVGIIQALLHQPELIILDEPTSGLDPLMQQRFFDLLVEENKKGATILFSSHILSEVQRLSHRVGIIKEGKLVDILTSDQIMKQQYKHVMIKSKTPFNFEQMSVTNIKNIHQIGQTVDFIYNGDINILLQQLSTFNIEDLSIQDPNLEDIFMHYYES